MNIARRFQRPLASILQLPRRTYAFDPSSGKNVSNTDTEKNLADILKKRFSAGSKIHVVDVSGGCGAMFDVTVISPEFEGMSIVKQHRMVTDALKEEIKEMHGLRISTHYEPFLDTDT